MEVKYTDIILPIFPNFNSLNIFLSSLICTESHSAVLFMLHLLNTKCCMLSKDRKKNKRAEGKKKTNALNIQI